MLCNPLRLGRTATNPPPQPLSSSSELPWRFGQQLIPGKSNLMQWQMSWKAQGLVRQKGSTYMKYERTIDWDVVHTKWCPRQKILSPGWFTYLVILAQHSPLFSPSSSFFPQSIAHSLHWMSTGDEIPTGVSSNNTMQSLFCRTSVKPYASRSSLNEMLEVTSMHGRVWTSAALVPKLQYNCTVLLVSAL